MPRNYQNYKSLPFNPNLTKFAKKNRRAGNLPEIKLWNYLKKNQIHGNDFDRQKIIGNYIADFYCSKLQLIIEIDGINHDYEADKIRDDFMEKLGIKILRISARDILYDFEMSIEYIYDVVEKLSL